VQPYADRRQTCPGTAFVTTFDAGETDADEVYWELGDLPCGVGRRTPKALFLLI